MKSWRRCYTCRTWCSSRYQILSDHGEKLNWAQTIVSWGSCRTESPLSSTYEIREAESENYTVTDMFWGHASHGVAHPVSRNNQCRSPTMMDTMFCQVWGGAYGQIRKLAFGIMCMSPVGYSNHVGCDIRVQKWTFQEKLFSKNQKLLKSIKYLFF